VKTYFFYIEDDRYRLPNLFAFTALDDAQALLAAQSKLAESLHHRSIDIFDEDRLVARIARGDDGVASD
jgi:hypothetical protein